MGNLECLGAATPQLAAAARDVCPFPDYSPGPLLTKMLLSNSSVHLSEHYAAVQASLTPQQQQDFTQTLRTTFGPEGKVSNGAVPVVALSLAIFFDAVASRVKGQYVSDQEPIPGLFLKDPTGTYPAPVYTISKYLRLVPHIANNPIRMRHETEKYVLELRRVGLLEVDKFKTAEEFDDITFINLVKCLLMGYKMADHLNQTVNMEQFQLKSENEDLKKAVSFNCDPKEVSERFRPSEDSLDDKSKRLYKSCYERDGRDTIENIIQNSILINFAEMLGSATTSKKAETGDFDLKANARGQWTSAKHGSWK